MTDTFRLDGAVALRLRQVRLDPGDEPIDVDVKPGTLHVLRMRANAALRILRVLAGREVAFSGTAATLNGVTDLTKDDHEPVLELVDLAHLTGTRSVALSIVGLTEELPVLDDNDAAGLRETLLFLVDVEGRTVLAAHRADTECSEFTEGFNHHPWSD